jgi:cystathionine gamma-synthase
MATDQLPVRSRDSRLDLSPDESASHYTKNTLAIHADDKLNKTTDVAPSMHVSTTFRYPSSPDLLVPIADEDLDIADPSHVYSRASTPNTTRLEAILSALIGGNAITYSSGLSAFHAMLVYLRPRVIAISGGYHGCHGVIAILTKLYGLKKVDLHNEAAWDEAGLGKGDIVHVETPLNPTGECLDLARFRELARKRGAYLTVDATFGPPGLQDPFAYGADVIMHSGTKYFGGHSDMLCGVLAVKNADWWRGMWVDRVYLGSVMGGLEGWLGVRSIRTLELRIGAQSRNAERLVQWLDVCMGGEGQVEVTEEEKNAVQKTVLRIQHASLQKSEFGWLKKQMPNGFGPVFALWMKNTQLARRLPSKLKLFHHATSLGGVESLIEWRKMSDAGVDERLCRLSIGIEGFEDLKEDLAEGFAELAREAEEGFKQRQKKDLEDWQDFQANGEGSVEQVAE